MRAELSAAIEEQTEALRLAYAQVADVDGCIVECGVQYGGTLSLLAALVGQEGKGRTLWGFDAFGTLPRDGFVMHEGEPGVPLAPSLAEVEASLRNIGGWDMLSPRIVLVEGWFHDTLPRWSGGPIALLHADCDAAQSYRDVLTHLWPHVAVGGVAVFDEYDSHKWRWAKGAIDDYLAKVPHVMVTGMRAYAVKLGGQHGRL